MGGDGQVSDTSRMTPQGGAEGTPGTDDGVPPAVDSGHESQGAPRDYDADDAKD